MATAEAPRDKGTAQNAEQEYEEMKDKSAKLARLFKQGTEQFDAKTELPALVLVVVLLVMFVFAGDVLNPTLIDNNADDLPWTKVVLCVAEIATTIVVLALVLPLIKGAKLAENTKLLLVAEHGDDVDEHATDTDKIEYQLERRLMTGARYWRTESMETDFKFYCANRHPILQFFAYGKTYGQGKFIRAVMESNAILMAVYLEQQTEWAHKQFLHLCPNPTTQDTVIQSLSWKVVIVLIPMFWSWLEWETLACPCQSSSARTGHFSSCALCCKFRMSCLMSCYWVLTAVGQLAHFSWFVPWHTKVAALGARSFGYLLFFAQNYVTWRTWRVCPLPFFGKWDKEKAKAEALLTGQVNSPTIRGESCKKATIKLCPVFTCACSPLIIVVLIIVYFLVDPDFSARRSALSGDLSETIGFDWRLILVVIVPAIAFGWQRCIRSAQRSDERMHGEEHLLAGEIFSKA